jgi:hypothetical protein
MRPSLIWPEKKENLKNKYKVTETQLPIKTNETQTSVNKIKPISPKKIDNYQSIYIPSYLGLV